MAKILAFHFSSGMPTLLAMPYRFILIAVAMVLAGCNNSAAEKPVKTSQQRVAALEAKLSKGPAVRSHKVEGGEFKVIDAQVSGFGGFTVRSQQCFVWRDAEYRTASLACPHPPELTIDRDGPDRGQADPAP